MNFASMWGVFLFATVKFMLSAFPGPALGLTFLETFLASFAGGTFSAAVFYFLSDWLMERAQHKKAEARKKALESGIPYVEKKKFTKFNRLIIQIKWKTGKIGTCFWAPLFLSIPVGSIVVAKFYGKLKETYPLIVLGMAINAAILTTLAYVAFG